MSESLGQNVVPFPPHPGASPLMGGPPPGAIPNPAYAAWQQKAQAAQAVIAQNQQLTAQFEAACALIRKDGIHGFKLDIEADSTIAPDEQAEQQARTQLIAELVPLLEQVIPMAMGKPAIASLARELTLFGLRGHKIGRPLEETVEQAFDAIAQMPPIPPKGSATHAGAAPPDPQLERAKVAADVHDTDQKAQTDRMAIAQKAQQAAQESATATQRAAAEDQHTQAELALTAAELAQRERLANAKVGALDSRAAGRLA